MLTKDPPRFCNEIERHGIIIIEAELSHCRGAGHAVQPQCLSADIRVLFAFPLKARRDLRDVVNQPQYARPPRVRQLIAQEHHNPEIWIGLLTKAGQRDMLQKKEPFFHARGVVELAPPCVEIFGLRSKRGDLRGVGPSQEPKNLKKPVCHGPPFHQAAGSPRFSRKSV